MEWNTLPSSEATWEHLEEMKERFLEFVLEDKDSLERNANDADEACDLKNAYNKAQRARLKIARQSQQAQPTD